MAYTGEHTLEAFSEFLEEKGKAKAEPGENVGILSRHCQTCCAVQAWSQPVETFLDWPQPQPQTPACASAGVVLTSLQLVPSPQQLQPCATAWQARTHSHPGFCHTKPSSPTACVRAGSLQQRWQRAAPVRKVSAALAHDFSWKEQSPSWVSAVAGVAQIPTAHLTLLHSVQLLFMVKQGHSWEQTMSLLWAIWWLLPSSSTLSSPL